MPFRNISSKLLSASRFTGQRPMLGSSGGSSRRGHARRAVQCGLLAALFAAATFACRADSTVPGKIHGHVQDPAGTPIANAQVQLSLDGGKTAKYTFTTDQNGDYTGGGIAPNTYVATLFQTPAKAVDRFQNVKITSGGDTTQDFDLSRPDYIAKLPPDERKQIEEAKKKNSQIVKENQNIKQLNGWLKQARADNDQKNFNDAAGLMQKAVAMKPDASVLWLELGIAQTGLKKYDDAIQSLKKAQDLESAAKKPNPEVQAATDNSLGDAYGSDNKVPDAVTAYDAAAKLQPANAAMYYTNETIVLSRVGQTDGVITAADKAIAADPSKPIPYYLKGQAMISKATVDPKTQKITAPPGTADAYRKYLSLDPNGPFAPEAQQILAEIGEKVDNKFAAGRK